MSMASGGNGFNPFKYASDCGYFFTDAELPKNVVIDFNENTILKSLTGMFFRTSEIENLTIKNITSEKTNLQANAFLYISPDIKTITFENCSFAPSTFESFGRSCNNLTTVSGELDCSNCKTGNALSFMFSSSNNLTDFRIKQNSISMSPGTDFGSSNLWSVATYVSLANGLNPNFAGALKLTANQIANCANIMGIVTGGIFTAVSDGAVSLSDFISNVKGWTVTT